MHWTLRIFLSNTCANQPFQVEARREAERKKEEARKSGKKKKAEDGDEEDEGDEEETDKQETGDEQKEADNVKVKDEAGMAGTMSSEEIPSWTLRIEGRLLEPAFRSRANAAQSLQAAQNRLSATKFSNLIKSIVVELVRDPALYPAGDNIVEWHKPTPSIAPPSASVPVGGESAIPGTGNALDAPTIAISEPSLDGFEVKRTGNIPVKARTVIYLNHTPERYALSPDLAVLLDIREETRQNVIAALWAYIKERKLLSEEDRRIVICDEPLRGIFRTDRIAFHHIPEVVNRHLHPAAPIVLEYWIRTDKDEYKHPTAFDIDVELEDNGLRKVQDDVLAGFDYRGRDIADLDDRIAQATQTLENRSSTRDFLHRFAQDPQGHIQTWMASQARDLDAILGSNYTTGGHLNIGTEELRRSETFNAPWVDQAVVVHEAQRVAEKMQALQKAGVNTQGVNPQMMAGQGGGPGAHSLASMRPR